MSFGSIDFDVNFYFSSSDNEGWTEHYITTQASVDDAVSVVSGLIPLRMAMMVINFNLVFARLSDMAIHGDSYPVTGISYPVVGTYPTSSGSDQTIANTALLVKLLGPSPFSGQIFFRGLNELITQGRHLTATTAFTTAFDAYASYLSDSANAFKINVEDPRGSGVMDLKQIQDVVGTKITSRKPGRPFGLPVGRRKRQAAVLPLAARQSTGSGRATAPVPVSPPAPIPSGSVGSSVPPAPRHLPRVPRSRR